MRLAITVSVLLAVAGAARADGAAPWDFRSHPVHITITVADDITDVDVYAHAHYPGLGGPILERATRAAPARVRFDGSGNNRNPGLVVFVTRKGDDPRGTARTELGRIPTSGRVWLLHAGLTVDEVYRVEHDGRGGYRLVQTYTNRSWWHTAACCSFWIGVIVALPWLLRRFVLRSYTATHHPTPAAPPGEPVAQPKSG